MVWVPVLTPPPPPAKKLWPRSDGPGVVGVGQPPTPWPSEAPYWTSLSRPVTVQPGTVLAAMPSKLPSPISAAPLTMRFGFPD